MDNEKQLNLTNLPSTLMSSTISPETSREIRSIRKRQREDDLSSDSDDEEQVDSLLKASVLLSMSVKMLSDSVKMLSNMVEEDYSSNTTTLPESLLKKAARAYLVHTLQSQEQPSPMSKSILSDAFDVGTFDFKVFQDMIRRSLTADDIRHVMLAIGGNNFDDYTPQELDTASKKMVKVAQKLVDVAKSLQQQQRSESPNSNGLRLDTKVRLDVVMVVGKICKVVERALVLVSSGLKLHDSEIKSTL